MKFKSLFRRKASPTGNDARSAISPTASSVSHSSSSSSIATHSASSPVHLGNGINEGMLLSPGSPASGRSRPDPELMSACSASPPLPEFSNFDEEVSGVDFAVAAANFRGEAADALEIKPGPLEAMVDNSDRPMASCQWEQQSRQSSGSEVSLACLQGRIQQMEDPHHSTNEELQATLQELSDLQAQLNEFQSENDRLVKEKHSLKQALECRNEQIQQLQDQVLHLHLFNLFIIIPVIHLML